MAGISLTLGGGGGGAGEQTQSGVINNGDASLLSTALLSSGETYEVTQATLVLSDAQPAPTNLDLVLISMDDQGNSNLEDTIISGDGSTQAIDETGDPLASYSFTSSFPVAAIYVDNGEFSTGTGSGQDAHASIVGRVA